AEGAEDRRVEGEVGPPGRPPGEDRRASGGEGEDGPDPGEARPEDLRPGGGRGLLDAGHDVEPGHVVHGIEHVRRRRARGEADREPKEVAAATRAKEGAEADGAREREGPLV